MEDKWYLKWGNETIGEYVFGECWMYEHRPEASKVAVSRKDTISTLEFMSFLQDRLPSPSRRDIDKILIRCGVTEYNPVAIAKATRAFNAKDIFWLATTLSEKMENVLPEVFRSVFILHTDLSESPIYSPEGVNIKRYAVYENDYGILKSRLYPLSTDVESEVAVYNLSKLLGVPCCPAVKIDERVFSKFLYDFADEYLVHLRRLLTPEEMFGELYLTLIKKFEKFKTDIDKVMLLDFITRQTDRHMSNIAIKVSSNEESLYPCYDNGRSLFFEDSVEFAEKAVQNIELYSTEFGEIGTYFDIVTDIDPSIINLEVSKEQFYNAYSAIPEPRRSLAVEWSCKCLEYLKTK